MFNLIMPLGNDYDFLSKFLNKCELSGIRDNIESVQLICNTVHIIMSEPLDYGLLHTIIEDSK